MMEHIPVLPDEVLKYLLVKDGPCRIVDGTIGMGGHSSLILKKNLQAEVMGIDRDGEALDRAKRNLAFASNRVRLFRGRFSDLRNFMTETGWFSVDGILLDLGFSSLQIDDPERGFSLRKNGPLDMRMDQRSPITASRLINREPESELIRIFREYGEIRSARRLAQAIIERRKDKPFTGTFELVDICEKVLGRSIPGRLPTPTRCFQALRIAVNDELGEIERILEIGVSLLAPGGRMAVISFHSLEDRIVKNFFRRHSSSCVCPPGMPVCICEHKASLNLVHKKIITASPEEIINNSRSSSAKLRVAEKREEV